ncbi:MAG: C40 family peptidase [Nocardioidaceae bacterium]|nr:C40 family peptidase [Nocardioidaceae bacterium]
MRSGTRRLIATVTASAATVALLFWGAPAEADKHKPGTPTQAQVDAAKKAADEKAGDVASLQAELAVANSRLQNAAVQAEVAAEAYNGAVWRLGQAQRKTAHAKAAAVAAAGQVDARRAGIAQLVTQSAQDGTGIARINAFLGGDGPEQIMEQIGAVQSAGQSLRAQYDEFTAVTALAQVAEKNAEKAQRHQAALAAKAAELRDEAAAAANTAQSEAARIAGQRRQLIIELADAQKISLDLATKRQHALEKEAEQKAAAAAAAKAKAEAEKAKAQAQQASDDHQKTQDELAALGPEGGWDDPGLPVPAGTSEGAKRAIQFARAQLGEPYVWAAAGPDSWDCSGLTMMSWRQGGVALPHYSAAQYQLTKHITAAQLKPGDLVFWGTSPNTIHHVALYIGNEQIIQAPRTGDVVKVSPLYASGPNFFGRP